ncbi:NADP-dependent oxidoreductase [Streptomyces sp. NBC_00059]|uniref:NADP-dependent oxidoreductase n=1 Tax=Streptomyces sp. NBC_00059 TaxID=2975635 RepID=UPI00225264B0|nr:NADP-dependent oxidoreductase [Streptomyces sp. NBC_00059]MCX5411508.1 NADP-dependent oxidoreductase [Streptomyces sp. NBC_00059]
MRAIAVSAFRAEPCLVEMPKPDPAAGEVRVKVEYAALNPRDWQIADGALDGVLPHVFPLVLGTDFAGRVDMIGSGDNRFRVGDPVLGRVTAPPVGRCGAYGEYVCVPQDSPIALVPRDLPLRTAAALPSAGTTAAQILSSTAVRSGRSLLVVGATGGVGSFLTQLAAARGIGVVAAVRGDEGRRMGALGATATVDTTDPGALEAAVRELYPGGVDALVDLVSTDAASFAAYAGLLADGGVAVTTRGVAAPAGVAWADFRLAPAPGLLDELTSAVASGELEVPVDMELPLEKAPQALAQNRAGGARGKTVFAL